MPLEIRDKTISSDIAVNSVILYSIKAENVLLFQDLLWTRVSWWISPGLEVHWLLHAHLDRQGIWLYFCWTWVKVAVFGLDLSVFIVPCLDIHRPNDTDMAQQGIWLYISFVWLYLCCLRVYLTVFAWISTGFYLFVFIWSGNSKLTWTANVSSGIFSVNGCVCSIWM